MTWQFDVNNSISSNSGAEWLYGHKVLLVSCGWTVPRSGDGTTGGDGDNISSVASLTDVNSWMVLRRPDDGAEWCFSMGGTSTTDRWDVLYSKGALFTGGTSSARATATDEQYLCTDASDLFISGSSVWNYCADDAAPYGWVLQNTDSGGLILYDPMAEGTYHPDDPDPYICATVFAYDQYRLAEEGDLTTNETPKGWTGSFWGSIPGCLISSSSGGDAFPIGLSVNPYSNKDSISPVPHARNNTQPTANGWKGFSTVVQWMGTSRAVKSTITTTTRSYIVWGLNNYICLPWPFQG